MTGITADIESILPAISKAECLKGWTLVGTLNSLFSR